MKNLDRFKFRVFYIEDKIMKYNAEKTYDDGCNGDNDISGSRFYNLIEGHRDLELVLMQSTGIYDIENNLVYEGDILEVQFESKTYKIVVQFDIEEGRYCRFKDYSIGKIIGNIYEHSHLLK